MSLWEMAYSQLNPVWKQYDAPYYDDYQYFSNFKEFELQKLVLGKLLCCSG